MYRDAMSVEMRLPSDPFMNRLEPRMTSWPRSRLRLCGPRFTEYRAVLLQVKFWKLLLFSLMPSSKLDCKPTLSSPPKA